MKKMLSQGSSLSQKNKVLVTPHVAFATNEASANGKETVIANIEAYVNGTPQNVITKK